MKVIWDRADHHALHGNPSAQLNDCRTIGALHDCRSPALQDCRTFGPLARCDAPPLHRLRPHGLLRTLALDDTYHVVFVPSASQVAVLDRETLGLLGRLPLGPGARAAELAVIEQLGAIGLLNDGSRDLPAPLEANVLMAWLHLTNACNLSCRYCYIQKSGEAMSVATVYAAIDTVIRAARRHGYPAIALKYAGGEASLRMDLIEAAHRYAQAQADRYGLTLYAGLLSNGTTLTTSKLARVAALDIRLMISLDGLGGEHDHNRPTLGGADSTQATLTGIARAIAAGLTPDIAITVTSANVAGLPGLVGWLLDRDLPFSISLYRDHHPGDRAANLRADEEHLIAGMRRAYAVIARRPPTWSLLGALLDRADLSRPHRRTCAVGDSYLVIDHRGRIAKCQMTLDQPISHIDAPDPLGMIRLDQVGVRNLPVEAKEGCRSCDWRYWCAGGCPVATYRATGRYDLRSPNCAIYQSLYPDVIRLEGLRLLHWSRQ